MRFSLQPFASTPAPPIQIIGNIARNENQLNLEYLLTDNIKEVVIATPANNPTRKHKLWEETCFEFFLGVKNSSRYWEFNLSPAGDWNVYRFDGYRQAMQEEVAFTTLPFRVEQREKSLAIALDVDLNQIVPPESPLDVAITAVLKHRDGEVTYWALTHQASEADFHLRHSFILEL